MVQPAPPRPRFLAPGDRIGKYDLLRQIAVGGMAELYLARTVGIEGFEKLVVLKRILPQLAANSSFVSMFLNEARLAAQLHHPNIAQVYDIGQEHGEYFFSMEYVHGEDLGRLFASAHEGGVPISLDAALTLVAGLCAGLHYAHDKAGPDGTPLNVVHRDVSPSNVLVSYDGAVKLVDFGIARAGTNPSTNRGSLKGKIAYMSPEQCRGKTTLDRRSDVFSIGTILYELTTGRVPFTDETEYGILNQIVNGDAEPPHMIVPGYPPALEAIVMRSLARDPEHRYTTALDMQHEVEDFAHENRLRVSPLVLARLMGTLFPQRLEEWAHARSQGAFFVEQHVVRTLIESGKMSDSVVPGTAASVPLPDEETTLPPAGDTSVHPHPAEDSITNVQPESDGYSGSMPTVRQAANQSGSMPTIRLPPGRELATLTPPRPVAPSRDPSAITPPAAIQAAVRLPSPRELVPPAPLDTPPPQLFETPLEPPVPDAPPRQLVDVATQPMIPISMPVPEVPSVRSTGPRISSPQLGGPSPRVSSPQLGGPAPRTSSPQLGGPAPRTSSPQLGGPAPRTSSAQLAVPATAAAPAPAVHLPGVHVRPSPVPHRPLASIPGLPPGAVPIVTPVPGTLNASMSMPMPAGGVLVSSTSPPHAVPAIGEPTERVRLPVSPLALAPAVPGKRSRKNTLLAAAGIAVVGVGIAVTIVASGSSPKPLGPSTTESAKPTSPTDPADPAKPSDPSASRDPSKSGDPSTSKSATGRAKPTDPASAAAPNDPPKPLDLPAPEPTKSGRTEAPAERPAAKVEAAKAEAAKAEAAKVEAAKAEAAKVEAAKAEAAKAEAAKAEAAKAEAAVVKSEPKKATPARVVKPPPRAKPPKKKTEARPDSKPDAKEEPWNENSPFMPVRSEKK